MEKKMLILLDKNSRVKQDRSLTKLQVGDVNYFT